ncbi:MAG: hypothetical protein FWD23_08090 [Oscillospiraceae bacterium]|nr:hypothetical protein [Oscillospiraceae bacterium]
MLFTKPYELKGKHATYIRFLNAYTKRLDKEAKVAGIFDVAVDVYVIAPLIGAAYNLRSPVDTESQDSFTLFGDAIINRQKLLDFVYRLVMLSEKSTDLSDDDRIERAYKADEKPELLEANLELFHQYMRGGVEWLYEHVTAGATIQEDYLDKVREIVTFYADDFEISQKDIDSDFVSV